MYNKAMTIITTAALVVLVAAIFAVVWGAISLGVFFSTLFSVVFGWLLLAIIASLIESSRK